MLPFPDHRFHALGSPAAYRDIRAIAKQPQRNCTPDATRAAGNYRNLSG